ncbi:ABC transporter substrate-binding protein [Sinirhodobacter sp. WL0062]|uniref:ABC transporter substrate-binding protein n=1 Tax=Rhodobacter flavimaris TaxID=2907145 RepID=A0ABS8Z2H0_9RHOB|nr:ABC transporter substrate-binding protein [Sinirhodobacter sp. WL0062]MCE5974959.1 ABC transporter substrate-binding protein [Sinirhodobacter sp. WL0062]
MRSKIAAVALALVLATGTAAAEAAKVMIVTWRGCEEACSGFQDYLTASGHDVAFTLRDAEQDKTRLPGFLDEARQSGTELILTWGTSATIGIAGTLADLEAPQFNHTIPQIFMIVADPVGAGVVQSLEETGRTNVTGTYNRMPETVTLQTIRSYMPAFAHLGLLFNADEKNSVVKRDEMAALAAEQGIAFTAVELPLAEDGHPRAQDIEAGMQALKDTGAEFVYVGSSSFLQAESEALHAAALTTKMPVISPYEDMVRKGHALISVAARYDDVGKLAGRLAEHILFEGATPGSLPVARMQDFAITIDTNMAREIGTYPPLELLDIAETVE